MKILVMDDSPSRLQKFEEWLQGEQFSTTTNVEQALTELKRQAFDLVFLDHDLGYGEPTGSVLTRRWKREQANFASQKPTVVVHTSSDAGANLMMTDLRLMGIEIIRKPFYALSGVGVKNIINKIS